MNKKFDVPLGPVQLISYATELNISVNVFDVVSQLFMETVANGRLQIYNLTSIAPSYLS